MHDASSLGPIVVVSGIPRSGTSLMMQILDQAGLPILSDTERVADESNPQGYFELAAVRRTREDASWVARAHGNAVKVIHSLLDALPQEPQYKVILMRRPVPEIVRSQDRMLSRMGAELGSLPTDRLKEILSEQYEQAREHLKQEACFEWIEVEYPKLVSEPLPQIVRVLNFLDLDADPGRLVNTVDPELYRENSEN